MRPEEPYHFFMLPHKPGDKITCSYIKKIVSKAIDIFPELYNDAFMIGDKF